MSDHPKRTEHLNVNIIRNGRTYGKKSTESKKIIPNKCSIKIIIKSNISKHLKRNEIYKHKQNQI